ncbi:putative uncharacterized protein [Waddlia chondrophila 2032/99]|uniref:Uncharacterized protein n=2 Tax=Waddlia chondrophila TaxID=71667 RepID=D6YWK5_WADCW|nr:hypothetical protein wcw_1159 [Waddlia chondrophila WSU 86-1044]CCB91598.1 putative uncharacterized protein [Waddlia chondrophila 2032/99]
MKNPSAIDTFEMKSKEKVFYSHILVVLNLRKNTFYFIKKN